ncbi:Bug family tripartite tricarboxylate transporter substrate binding protein [Aquabacterium sp. J223]|uniref:Bug family tripartite tricarboxylate transporter substrate binding protein n=1 Tax=Aquabacterium sp. J223 TaxID=2898431 RepID=UPI0021ADDE1A|nr:tripartite tricarboxylate transporter substrate binding protein [Aquabacterium sp. J223]UUX94987.1 tripartite tricarboxylate transporter substrate binding protein [Aquabacterium sp. J223]
MQRRLVLAALGSLSTGLCGLARAQAGAYPNKPVRLVVPFAPGGPTDVAGRLLAQKLGALLGQQVIVDNRPGAGGTVGAAAVAQAPADGYTLLFGSTSTLAVSPALYPRLPYDAATAFQPVALVARGPQMLVVHPSVPAADLKEFVAFARRQAQPMSFASAGNGSVGHLTAELLKSVTGIPALHVPYKGGSPAVNAVVAGETQFTIDAVGTMLPFVKAGRLKAVSLLGESRSPLVPALPTAVESGFPKLVADFWSGVVAPAGTPREVLARLETDIAKVVADPEVVEQLRLLGTAPQRLSVDEFTRFVREEARKWAEIAQASGAKAE